MRVPPGVERAKSVALSWSGGKDSALTLWRLRRWRLEPEALITTLTERYDRISMHGVRRELLARQSAALGVPLVEVVIPPACVNEIYETEHEDIEPRQKPNREARARATSPADSAPARHGRFSGGSSYSYASKSSVTVRVRGCDWHARTKPASSSSGSSA